MATANTGFVKKGAEVLNKTFELLSKFLVY
jgi:hypothetical protein